MKKWDKKQLDEIKDIQNNKLQNFINYQLYPFSPHYKRLFDDNKIDPKKIKQVSDLKYIPFTKKEDLLPTEKNGSKYLEFVLQPDEAKIKKYWPKTKLLHAALRGKKSIEREYRPIFLTATTGRTYQPISFLYSAYDIENLKRAGNRLAQVMDIKTTDRGVNMFPYAPHLAFWQVAFAGFDFGAFILSTGGGKVLGTKGNLGAVEKIKPQLITGTPGYVYHILRTSFDEKKDFSSVEKVALGAEKVPIPLKEKMYELLVKMGSKNPKIFGTYGFTEARMAWVECPTEIHISSGYHAYPDMEMFEIINPDTGEVVREGEDGEVVYTNLDARGSCVLRYRTGDFARGGIIYSPCPHCGRTVPRLSSDLTRVSNIKEFNLTKIKGTLVNLNIIAELLSGNKDIEEWQIEISKKNNDPYELDVFILNVSPRIGANIDGLRKIIFDNIVAETEISPNEIRFLPLPEILSKLGMETEMKEKRILDLRF